MRRLSFSHDDFWHAYLHKYGVHSWADYEMGEQVGLSRGVLAEAAAQLSAKESDKGQWEEVERRARAERDRLGYTPGVGFSWDAVYGAWHASFREGLNRPRTEVFREANGTVRVVTRS